MDAVAVDFAPVHNVVPMRRSDGTDVHERTVEGTEKSQNQVVDNKPSVHDRDQAVLQLVQSSADQMNEVMTSRPSGDGDSQSPSQPQTGGFVDVYA